MGSDQQENNFPEFKVINYNDSGLGNAKVTVDYDPLEVMGYMQKNLNLKDPTHEQVVLFIENTINDMLLNRNGLDSSMLTFEKKS